MFLLKEVTALQLEPYKPQPSDVAHWAFLSAKPISFRRNEGLEHKLAPQLPILSLIHIRLLKLFSSKIRLKIIKELRIWRHYHCRVRPLN